MRFTINFRQLFAVYILICINLLSHAEILVGKVVGVSDGDTITVLDATKTEHKVRLMGIDAPEKSQDFGKTTKLLNQVHLDTSRFFNNSEKTRMIDLIDKKTQIKVSLGTGI